MQRGNQELRVQDSELRSGVLRRRRDMILAKMVHKYVGVWLMVCVGNGISVDTTL